MGAISVAAMRGCRATCTGVTAALTAGARALGLAGSASPAPAAAQIFPGRPAGLSEPAGLAVTPDGALWASDALLGLCRIDRLSRTLVRDEFCAPPPAEALPLP